MRRGFTLVEVLAAIVIVSTLAAIAIPSYTKSREKVNEREAWAYLRVIRVAQKMYYARFGTYACTATCADAAAIKTALGVEIRDNNYGFSIAATASTFTVTTSGGPAVLTVDQDGNFTKGGSPYTPI